MADVLHQVTINASAQATYDAITQETGLQGWWSEHSHIEGSLASVSFYNNAVTFKLRVTKQEPNTQVVWAVEAGAPDWPGTEITWVLAEDNGQTTLNFAHRGFPSTEGHFANVNYTWGWYATSLKFYLEKGKGMPHTDADMM